MKEKIDSLAHWFIDSIDLLQKCLKVEFKVVESSNQVESQREALSPVAIAFQQDAKDFQTANHIFNHDPPP